MSTRLGRPAIGPGGAGRRMMSARRCIREDSARGSRHRELVPDPQRRAAADPAGARRLWRRGSRRRSGRRDAGRRLQRRTAATRRAPPPRRRVADRRRGSFARELRALHGYPLVVNKWASWCPPCRAEFPIFQRVAPQYARRVAFLGDDVNDTDGRSWLQRFPVSYPSFLDRSGTINDALGPAAASYTPVTYFFDRAGRQVYAHFGPYLSAASLRRDIHDFLGA